MPFNMKSMSFNKESMAFNKESMVFKKKSRGPPSWTLLLGAVLSAVALILSSLCLAAGGSSGTLQDDVYIIKFNMSNFGEDLISTFYDTITSTPSIVEDWVDINSDLLRRDGLSTRSRSSPLTARQFDSITDLVDDVVDETEDLVDDVVDEVVDTADDVADTFTDLFDDLSDAAQEIGEAVLEALEDIINDLIDLLSDALGLPDVFSAHLTSVCTIEDVDEDELECTDPSVGYGLGLPESIDTSLTIGGFSVPLVDFLGDEISEAFESANDDVTTFVGAICVMYILGLSFAGLSFLLCIFLYLVLAGPLASNAMFSKPLVRTVLVTISLGVSSFSTLCLFVGSVLTSVVASFTEDLLSGDLTDLLGIEIDQGEAFVWLSWLGVAAMAMGSGCLAWAWMVLVKWKAGERENEIEMAKVEANAEGKESDDFSTVIGGTSVRGSQEDGNNVTRDGTPSTPKVAQRFGMKKFWPASGGRNHDGGRSVEQQQEPQDGMLNLAGGRVRESGGLSPSTSAVGHETRDTLATPQNAGRNLTANQQDYDMGNAADQQPMRIVSPAPLYSPMGASMPETGNTNQGQVHEMPGAAVNGKSRV